MATVAAQSIPSPKSTASGSGSLANRKSLFEQNRHRIRNFRSNSDIHRLMETGSSHTSSRSMRSSIQPQTALRSNQTQSQMHQKKEYEDSENEPRRTSLFRRGIKGALAEAAGIEQQEEDNAKNLEETKKQTKNLISKQIEKAWRFEPFSYVLIWCNLKMIVGTWLLKGKGRLIPPLTYEEFKQAGVMDKKPHKKLQGVLVLIDLFVLFGVLVQLILIAFVLVTAFELMDTIGTTAFNALMS